MPNHVANLPQEAKLKLKNLLDKRGIMLHMEGPESDMIFMMDVLNWIYAPTDEFPYKPKDV